MRPKKHGPVHRKVRFSDSFLVIELKKTLLSTGNAIFGGPCDIELLIADILRLWKASEPIPSFNSTAQWPVQFLGLIWQVIRTTPPSDTGHSAIMMIRGVSRANKVRRPY